MLPKGITARYIPGSREAALVCERAGADSIDAHLIEDRRHNTEKDLADKKNSYEKAEPGNVNANDIVDFGPLKQISDPCAGTQAGTDY
jgi:pyridoxine 5'-phosphate synthase PdxJ